MNDVTKNPLAQSPLISYRCKSLYGWIMIGAKDEEDAMSEALRSSELAKREDLQKWDGTKYQPIEGLR